MWKSFDCFMVLLYVFVELNLELTNLNGENGKKGC